MHPSFYVVDHRIDHDPLPFEERRGIRRNQPAHLRLTVPPPGLPLVNYVMVNGSGDSLPLTDIAPRSSRLTRFLHRLWAGRQNPAPAMNDMS